jgi:hypothetical protein
MNFVRIFPIITPANIVSQIMPTAIIHVQKKCLFVQSANALPCSSAN